MKVLHEAKRKQITQREAGERLKVSERWVRRLLARMREEGDRGILHRLRGRVSQRRLPAQLEARAVRLVKAKYGDFGPTLAAEYLAQYEGVEVSKETLRKWLVTAGVRRAPSAAVAVGRRPMTENHRTKASPLPISPK